MQIKVSNIMWDTDGKDIAGLPDEVVVEIPDGNLSENDITDIISEMLSDEYGFCHTGFAWEQWFTWEQWRKAAH